jgi:hypothetical protein
MKMIRMSGISMGNKASQQVHECCISCLFPNFSLLVADTILTNFIEGDALTDLALLN